MSVHTTHTHTHTTHTLRHGTATIEYELHYAKRKTLGITVYPDLRVAVRAPLGTAAADIETILHKRSAWILKKQREFEHYLPGQPPRRYVSGETHLYLGRQYRLKVVESDWEGVKLTGGRFYVHTARPTNVRRIKTLLEKWYRQKAAVIFAERLEHCYARAQRFGLPFPELRIRIMKKRWGSCHPNGTILLNLKLIQAPKFCIDYVITHELAHFQEPNHGAGYYALLDRLMPDWRERKRKLNEFQVA
jgi:predicted metal-dependent hydrolase